MFGLDFSEIAGCLEPKKVVNSAGPHSRFRGVALDTRGLKKGEAFLALKGRSFDGHDFLLDAQRKGASFLVVEKIPAVLKQKIKIPVLVIEDSLKALGLLSKRLVEKYSPKVCAVTGSLGKTTVKEMIGHVLRGRVPLIISKGSENNQIGLPKTLLSLNKTGYFCVVELGTNHFGEISYLADICCPEIGVITCVDNAHLKSFKTKRGVLREKVSLFKACPLALPVLNFDDKLLRNVKIKVKPVYFGENISSGIYFNFLKREKDSVVFKINSKYLLRLKTLASFNVYNACACMAVCRYWGIPLKYSSEALSDFHFPKMRFQMKRIKGAVFINDAYNSNPRALKKALESLKLIPAKRKIAVLADMLELGERALSLHCKVSQNVYEAGFFKVILLGKFMHKMGRELILKGVDKNKVVFAKDVKDAARHLAVIIGKGDLAFLKGSRKFALERVIPQSSL